MHNNNLVGSIPESLGSLESLNRLYLSSNNLKGSIPKSFGTLTNLGWMYVRVCHVLVSWLVGWLVGW
jgi:hypothetical protein